MLKLLDKYSIANLAFFAKGYQAAYPIPALMTLFIASNVWSAALIILPYDFQTNSVLLPSLGVPIAIMLYIRYNDSRCETLTQHLRALSKGAVLKYQTLLVVYYIASVALVFFAAYFSKYYTINWSWLF